MCSKICKYCGCIDSHIGDCKNQTREGFMNWIKHYRKTVDRMHEGNYKIRKQITFWQGKYNLVKHENNKLRKKLYNREKGRLEKC